MDLSELLLTACSEDFENGEDGDAEDVRILMVEVRGRKPAVVWSKDQGEVRGERE